jgi:hypothetical protein
MLPMTTHHGDQMTFHSTKFEFSDEAAVKVGQFITRWTHLAPQNAPQIESCIDAAYCRLSSLLLIEWSCVTCRSPMKTIRTLSHG